MEGDYKVAIGAYVRDRLAAMPGMFKIPAPSLDIFALRDFLSGAECDALIGMIDAGRQPSTVLAENPDPSFRTSESCNLDPHDATVRAIEAKITKLVGIEPSHGETIQGQRYAVGQEFRPHHDFFFTDQPYWPREEAMGGQRTWTAMIFLNAPEAGGQTYFPTAGVRVTPRRGNILAWNNLDAAGRPNHASLHQGMPVLAGVKYIITKWYRERLWAETPRASQ